jgi:hypothetical protein
MWIEPKGFEDTHARGNTEAHRLQDPSKWVPFGVGAIEGSSAPSLRVLEPGAEAAPAEAAAAPAEAAAAPPAPPKEYGPGEEPRPRDGEPTGSAHGELL